MKHYPIDGYANEPTIKQVWLLAFTAALHRVGPAAALLDADEALRIADARWKEAPTVGCWEYRHSYPLGHRFHDEEPRDSTASAPPAHG